MSGHNKWSQIKHQKGAKDAKKGALFTKILGAIAISAKQNPKPEENPRLRTLIEKAKEASIPGENIQRAISRAKEQKDKTPATGVSLSRDQGNFAGTREGTPQGVDSSTSRMSRQWGRAKLPDPEGLPSVSSPAVLLRGAETEASVSLARRAEKRNRRATRGKAPLSQGFKEFTFECVGPEGTLILVEGVTDSSNRTMQQLRTLAQEIGCKPAEQGSTLWAFKLVDEIVDGVPSRNYHPQFPQPSSPEVAEKIKTIISSFEEYDDTSSVVTNILL